MITRFAILASVTLIASTAATPAKAHCVKDPATNEPTCNYEARSKVSRKYGFWGLSHVEVSQRIEADPKWSAERDVAYKRCMKAHNFCPDE